MHMHMHIQLISWIAGAKNAESERERFPRKQKHVPKYSKEASMEIYNNLTTDQKA